MLEHVLLRPQLYIDVSENGQLVPDAPDLLPIDTLEVQSAQLDANNLPAAVDPYSFWVSIIFPATPQRFGSRNFRQLIERTLRSEAPAHIVLKIGWFGREQMQKFETAYDDWRKQLALKECEGHACHLADARNELVKLLRDLQSDFSPDRQKDTERPALLVDEHIKLDPGADPFLLDETLLLF